LAIIADEVSCVVQSCGFFTIVVRFDDVALDQGAGDNADVELFG